MVKPPGRRREDTRTLSMGQSDAALDPAMRAALATLRAERDEARAEAQALRLRLAETEQLADRDALTPVLNRRAFTRELQRTVAFCMRYGGPAALIYLDLDRFKAVNDRFGHAAGDAALARVADLLVQNVRESDVVGRLGGDEFGVILAQADFASARTKAETLAERLGAEPLVFETHAITLCASTGVRAWEPGLEAAQWLAEADATMFLNKGRR